MTRSDTLLPILLVALCASPAAARKPADSSAAQAAADARAAEARHYLERITALDDAADGPHLNAVIAVNPAAPDDARRLSVTGALAGRTVLVKDNIETRELPTTAGSLALKDNMTGRDAPLIARLRKAGGVVLGKTNLSEWANMRSSRSTSGWSAVGGLTLNPHALDRTTCGSSSGSGAAVAAGMAWAAIGTETDGSITCPAAMNGIVGLKPTVGLVSRTHVVPISHSQDTAGPMAANVHDAALLLSAIAGSDPADPATAEADAHATDFTAGLASASLKGVRIGVIRRPSRATPELYTVYEQALADLRRAGAELVDIPYQEADGLEQAEFVVLLHELRTDIAAYLASLPGTPPARDLAGLIAFNKAHAAEEMPWFGQELFEAAERTTDEADYQAARAAGLRLAGAEGIDRLLAANNVAFLVSPTSTPAFTNDLVNGGHYVSVGAGTMPAVAGYPHLTVPMGAVHGLPVGLSFIGAKWDDKRVLEAGAAYERARSATLPAPSFRPWGE